MKVCCRGHGKRPHLVDVGQGGVDGGGGQRRLLVVRQLHAAVDGVQWQPAQGALAGEGAAGGVG